MPNGIRSLAVQRVLTLFVTLGLFLAASAAAATAGPDPTSASWDAIVRAARAEGALQVSGPRGLDELQSLVTEGFEASYGIRVDYSRAGPDELVRNVPLERASGEYRWD